MIPDLDLKDAESHLTPTQFHRLAQLLIHYKDRFLMTTAQLGNTPFPPACIPVTTEAPIVGRRYHNSAAENERITAHTDQYLRDRIIVPSFSPYSTPVLLVPKRDGKWRFAIDYRKLNKHIVQDRYPLPRIDDTLDSLKGNTWFTSLDLMWGFWNIRLNPQDRHHLAFTTASRHFEWVVLPFGFVNSPSIFQRNMDLFLAGLKWWCALVYIDDILVFSPTFDEHLQHLALVLQCITDYNMALKPPKCHFCAPSLPYLGHVITPSGIRPDPRKIRALLTASAPSTRKDLEHFLGALGYLQQFIPQYSNHISILQELKISTAPWTTSTWTSQHQESFDAAKRALSHAVENATFDPSLPIIVETDASYMGIAAVLLQQPPGATRPRPIICVSCRLTPTERRYMASEIECLALWWAIKKKFRPYLHLRPFTVVTDHRSLIWLWKSQDHTSRLFRWWEDL